MYLLEAPKGLIDPNQLHGHAIVDGKILVFKQYWWHLFRRMWWRDITPPGWGGNSVKPKNMKRVLHIHHSAFGDMLFVTPLFRVFAEKFPGIVQEVITGRKGAIVLQGNPWVAKITIDRNLPDDDVIAEFDDVINYDGLLTVFPESELMNVYDLASEWAGVELKDDEKKPEMHFLDHEERIAQELLVSWGFTKDDRYVVMQYDASSNVRTIPHGTLIELAERIAGDGYRVILFGSGDLGKRVSWKCGNCGRRNFHKAPGRERTIIVHCSCGHKERVERSGYGFSGLYFIDSEKVTIRTIALLIEGAAAFIGPDSCGIHLAGCFGTPSLGIFFSFDGDLRMRYYRNSRCMQIDVPCGPCFQHGKLKCRHHSPDGFSRCVEKLTAGEIYEKFARMMRGEQKERILPFTPGAARPCPVCCAEERYYVCRKRSVCYFECLRCSAIYTDREVEEPVQRIEGYYDRHLPQITEYGHRNLSHILHKRFFTPGVRVLEVGCGEGHTLDELQRRGWEVEGIERSLEVIGEAEKKYPGLAGKMSRVAFLDFHTEKKFTLLWMNRVFERFHNPRDIFRHAYDLLDESGVFSMQVTDGDLWREGGLRTLWHGINATYAGEYSLIPNERSLRFLGDEFGFDYSGKETLHDPGCQFIKFRKVNHERTHVCHSETQGQESSL